MLNPSYLAHDWQTTPEGKEILSCLFTRNKQSLRTFGLLESPPLSNHIEEVRYKIFVSGKSGVGKTSTVAKLTGHDISKSNIETPGIQTSLCFWPAKVTDINKVMLFRLQFWDAGEGAIKKYDHILPGCTDKMDAVLFVFSIVDKSSFDELHQQISRLTTPTDNIAKIAIATKCDQHAHREVTAQDMRDFEKTWKMPILMVRNTVDANQVDMGDIMPTMNKICELLWQRDLILAGKLPKPIIEMRKTVKTNQYV